MRLRLSRFRHQALPSPQYLGAVSGGLEAQMKKITVKRLYYFDGAWYIWVKQNKNRERKHQKKDNHINDKLSPPFLLYYYRKIHGGNSGKPRKAQQ